MEKDNILIKECNDCVANMVNGDISDILNVLNEKQKECVVNINGPYLIIAGPGSGKTKTLITKLAYLIANCNIDSRNILALTYTNKAAHEMKTRLKNIINTDKLDISLGTFHSIFAKILRNEAQYIGYDKDYTIYEPKDSKDLIKTICNNHNINSTKNDYGYIYERISLLKNKLVFHDEYEKFPEEVQYDIQCNLNNLGFVYKEYVKECRKINVMDFDDILVYTYKLFRDNPEILEKYQNMYKYVFVDEFQDTNVIQYKIVQLLVKKHHNITVVGDDSQSIYGFRGANVGNILNFSKDYPNTKVIKLEQNYRSTKNIVDISNQIIKNNQNRIAKTIWTDNEEGKKTRLIRSVTDLEEAKAIANGIIYENKINNIPYQDIAILYRNNSQSTLLEGELSKLNIPYRIYGAMSLFQHQIIKDIVSYIKVVVNNNDNEALKRIINVPRRSIGKVTINRMLSLSQELNISIFEVLKHSSEFFELRMHNILKKIVNMINTFSEHSKIKNAYEMVLEITNETQICTNIDEISDSKKQKLQKELVETFFTHVKTFVDDKENVDKSLSGFLQNISLSINDLENNNKNTDVVSLMTVHASKGLEFRDVYVVGLVEEIFPSISAMTNASVMEDERRLFYVAVTRAKENLFLSYSISRFYFNKTKQYEMSRFLSEIDKQFFDSMVLTLDLIKLRLNQNQDYIEANNKKTFSIFRSRVYYKHPTNNKNNVINNKNSQMLYNIGDVIHHGKYGYGNVIEVNQEHESITVRFNEKECRTIIPKYSFITKQN